MKNKNGFTLVELSIVVVIIGLLISGVLVGQSLIQNAKIKSLIVQIQDLHANIRVFQDKYLYIPGDHPQGASLFPNCGSNSVVTFANAGGNGNGNHRIDTGISVNEHRITVCNLAEAGLIQGSDYRRAGSQSSKDWVVGETVIRSIFSLDSGILLTGANITGGTANAPEGYRYSLSFGIPSTTSPCQTMCGKVLTARDALDIDLRIDDGIPNTGFVRPRTLSENAGECGLTSYIDLGSSDAQCALNFYDPPKFR